MFTWFFNRLTHLKKHNLLIGNYQKCAGLWTPQGFTSEEFYQLDDHTVWETIKHANNEPDELLKTIARSLLFQFCPRIIYDLDRTTTNFLPEEEGFAWNIIDLKYDFKLYQAKQTTEQAKIYFPTDGIKNLTTISMIIKDENRIIKRQKIGVELKK